jgi:phage-related minor tail protein
MATLAELLVKLGVDDSDLKAGMDEAPKHADSAVAGIKSKFEGLGDKLAPIAKAAGIAAGAAVVAGAVIGIEQEALSDKLAAQLDLSESESALAGQIAGGLYADAYGESFGQVNDAVGAVIGHLTDDLSDPAAIEGLSAKVLDLASTFDLDVVDAVSRVGALLEGGLARDADHAMDLITASFQTVAPGLRDELADATREYSKHFGDLGITGEETFGLLAAADDQFTLDKTGDAIKELSIRATDMSALSVGAFDAMGLDAEDMADRILAGGDTARGAFDEIIDGLLKIEDPADQANTAIALFGTPIEDIGTAKIPDFLASLDTMDTSLGSVEGAADRMGDTLNTNAQTTITGYKRSIEQMLAKVVEAPGILGEAAGAVAGLGQVMAPLAPAMTGMAILFQGNLGKISDAAGKAFTAIKSGFGTMIKFVMANPWVLLVAATIALVVLIVKNWDTILSFLKGAWEWIQKTASSVGNWLKNAFKTAVDFIYGLFLNFTPLGLIIKHFDKIKDLATGVKDWISDRINDIVDFFTKMPTRITGVVGGLFDGLKNAFKNAVNWVIDKWNDFRLEIKLPSLLGGGTIGIDTPNIPRFHDGGTVPGVPGEERLILAEGGEKVTPADEAGPPMVIQLHGLPQDLVRMVGREVAWQLGR